MFRGLKLTFSRFLRKRLSPKNDVSDRALQVMAGSAEDEVSAMERNVREMAQHVKVPSEATALAAQVINGVDGVLKLVSAIASSHPILNIVVQAVVTVVELEKKRHENHAQIAKVHYDMVTTVYHLKVLGPITATEDELQVHLGETIDKMAKTITEFGSFVECWQRIFKLLHASHHRQKLEHFSATFEEHKKRFDHVVQTRFATQSLRQLESIQADTRKIMERLSTIEHGFSEAEIFIQKHGANTIINNDQFLERLAEMVGERVTDNMKRTLREDFDVLLRKNTERFEMKLQSVERNVLASMDAARGEIIRKLNAGPHEVIQDEVIQKIWKGEDWKSTVKCGVFVEALREHYQKEFDSYSVSYNGDAWTVEFFSRMIYHSAIGDIVDEDGSGHITASEMNAFCNPKPGLRPSKWTTAQWFALYYHCVKRSLKQIDRELGARNYGDRRWRYVEKIVKSLKPLLWIEDIEDDDNLRDSLNPNILSHLRRLQETYRAEEMRNITSRLDTFDFHLEDQSAVAAIMGDTRVELHVMCALHILVDKLKHHNNRGEFYSIEQVATSCMVVYLAFEARMHTLMRGWRSQGHDIELQLGRYADGLFQNFHREAPKRKKALNDLCKTLFDHTPPRFRSMIKSASHAPHTQMDDLAQQVATLTKRFANLEPNLVQGVVPEDTALGDEENASSEDDSTLWDAYLDRPQSWLQSLTSAAMSRL
ncbi:hypothetical protein C8Q74DRAFT_1368256 [Fomes fomentarius]|nr:hypothetical protein C8Q74DRAFT_1368256 [Fomes fomentarius]